MFDEKHLGYSSSGVFILLNHGRVLRMRVEDKGLGDRVEEEYFRSLGRMLGIK
jgi:hypothetical protein